MKAHRFSLYIFIAITTLSTHSLHTQTYETPQMVAFLQSALSGSRAVAKRTNITSAFLWLGTSFVVAESISYTYRKKTFLMGSLKRYAHDVAYWAVKKILCMPGSPKPTVLQTPYLYKN